MTSRAAAVRYARALFDVAVRDANPERIDTELREFAGLISAHDALANTFANPAVPVARKRGVAQALIDRAGPLSPPLAKLILLLADRDRLMLLPAIASAFRDRLQDHQHIVRGEVKTAVPLAPGTLEALQEGLGRVSGRRVVLESRVDPSIIGGVITRLGSTVYDGSVTTQLEKMKQALKGAAQ